MLELKKCGNTAQYRHLNGNTCLSVSPKDTVVIGDAPYDILMGKNAGATAIGVTYGNSKREELQEADADFLIDSFADLLKLPI